MSYACFVDMPSWEHQARKDSPISKVWWMAPQGFGCHLINGLCCIWQANLKSSLILHTAFLVKRIENKYIRIYIYVYIYIRIYILTCCWWNQPSFATQQQSSKDSRFQGSRVPARAPQESWAPASDPENTQQFWEQIYIYMYVWLVGQSSQSHRPTLTGCRTGVKLKSPNPAGEPGLLQWLPKASWGGVAGRNSALGDFFLPKQCGHTEGVLTVGVKARWLIDMVSGAFGMFPIIFRDILPRNLLEGACTEILLRDLMEIFFWDLAKRPLTEILPAELL